MVIGGVSNSADSAQAISRDTEQIFANGRNGILWTVASMTQIADAANSAIAALP